ncbi:CRISPR-associated helicase Cas3' [Salegentibacter sp. F188]|uniref:CRISPR-associated helicase Cas3 n=1 Tax=Autumnicola patrickiae TaxID=3075591 RepID=A0ABU3E156_9FLAO|nr:CRISPR-associated helicase Cas3' [Salegentibacter sp. F188]MDT0689724.1 CRISPR-associated helicase Cas3' [Salegentibacter sp. F188]
MIFKNNKPVDQLLKNAEKYWAHTPSLEGLKEPETLKEHIELVNVYCEKLIETHHLDSIINRLIESFLSEFPELDKCGDYLKKLFLDTVIYHDYGKINENFQVDKMRNPGFTKVKPSPISSRHSSLGGFIYLANHFQEIHAKNFNRQEKVMLFAISWYFAYSIFKHHGFQFHDDIEQSLCFSKDTEFVDIAELKDFMKSYVEQYHFEVNPALYNLIGNPKALKDPSFTKYQKSFPLYALCRLNFSLLTASDYLATNEYMNCAPLNDFGVLSKERIDTIFEHVTNHNFLDKAEEKENYNRWTYEKLKNETYFPEKPTQRSGTNLNKLRQAMAIETIRNLRKNIHRNLFYIEAPTGGGKTNLSLLSVLDILKAYDGKINKVFYVFPFTTLITQTYKSIKEVFALGDDEVVQLHSKAGFKEKETEKEDDNYGGNKINYIHHLFANFPFTLLTHVRFFDILKTDRKETNYLLHRLANSVVVIDELQSYPPQHWDKVIYFIKKFASALNIKFILMSATLPKIDKLKIDENKQQDFSYLLPNAKKDYFQNPNFCDRVNFDLSLSGKKELQLDELAETLLKTSKAYAEKDFGEIKPAESVYTIIEFIFKKSASDFHQLLKDNDFFDEVFLLSGTILEPRRKYIIDYLKNIENRKKRVLLVTTQVVEAGVDIDMDIGFKDRSLIDSDEQLAGRINRNINKKECRLFLFKYDKAGLIYKDERLKISQKLKPEEYRLILRNKDFDRLYYDKVIKKRNEAYDTKFLKNFKDYRNLVESLKFKSVNDQFKLIEQNNISCFIPLPIPIIISENKEKTEYTFSKSERDFLEKHSIFPNKENKISGEEVFDLYLNIIQQKQGFITKKTSQKILQGIISNFIFSIFASDKIKTEIIKFSDEEKSEFGYQYIESWKKFYDYEEGFNADEFQSIETQFL